MGEPVLLLISVRAQQVGLEAIVHKVCIYLHSNLNTTYLHSVDADYKELVTACFGVPFCSCLCS